jgi:hypothetical protein
MDFTTLALFLARTRLALGAAAVLAPGPSARVLTGRSQTVGVEPQLTRMVGCRDMALGLGTVIALDRGKPVRGWLEASAYADAGDFLAALLGRKQMSQRAYVGTLAVTAAAVALGLWTGRALDPAPGAHPGQPEAVVTGHPG